MIYKKVAKIEEEISAIGVGCWGFGGDFDSTNDGKTKDIIMAAVSGGINFFDVAPVYGWGHSEEMLGRILKEESLRSKVIIASKGGLLFNERHETCNNLSKKSLLWEVEQSLRRLQTDYIDIYQLHWPDSNVPLEETAEALIEMKKAGKIRYVGLSNFSQSDMEKMMGLISVDCQQSLYNMLERNPVSYHNIPLEYLTEKEVLPNVVKYGQAFLPYSPLFQGLLAGKFNKGNHLSPSDIRQANPKLSGPDFAQYMQAANELKELSDRYSKPMNEIAVNWLRQKPEVTCIIGGASSVQQMEQNMHSLSWDINDEMMKEIDRIITPFENK